MTQTMEPTVTKCFVFHVWSFVLTVCQWTFVTLKEVMIRKFPSFDQKKEFYSNNAIHSWQMNNLQQFALTCVKL